MLRVALVAKALAMTVVLVAIVPSTVMAQAGSPIVPPPPVQTQAHVDVTVQAPPPDPKAIADASSQSFQSVVVTLIAPTLVDWTNELLNIPDIIRHTPADLTYANQGVQQMASIVNGVTLGLIALAIFGFGLATALHQKPSPGRLVFAIMLSLSNMAWWHMGIDLLNSINDAIAAPSTLELVKPHMQLPDIAADPVKSFGPAVLLIVFAVVVLLLFISAAMRLGLVDILMVLGSLALLCGAVEDASAAMAFYSRYLTLSVGTLFSQVLIVVCLKLVPIIGVVGSGIAGTIIGLSILLLARRMPQILASAQSERSGGGIRRLATTLIIRRFIPI